MDDEAEYEDERNLEPGPEITRELFRQWQPARRGSRPAEDMSNPVWEWLFRGRIDPYHAHQRFKDQTKRRAKGYDFPKEPRWAGCRLGQSATKLSDGREIWIAGEHEDYYDPDFFIYNDVIVRHPDGRIQIFGYPESDFLPTDFHTATPIDGESAILIIGSIGYPSDRREERTPVYCLDTRNYQMTEVETSGEPPGWIHKHEAAPAEDGSAIVVRGGNVFIGDEFVENIDEWSLRLDDYQWVRLTDRKWPQLKVGREDQSHLHLFQYGSLEMELRFPELAGDNDLESELGAPPNLEVYKTLFTPSLPHTPVERDSADDAWRTTTIVVNGVRIRFVDDMNSVKVVVEGRLAESTIDALTGELRDKLALVENSPCTVQRVG